MSDLTMVKRFVVEDAFFGRYERLVKETVLPYQEAALSDRLEGAEKSHCLENFRMAAQKLRTGSCDGEFYGMVFQDSDIAKWLEGAAYSLALYPDAELEARCDEVIELIASAQQDDGYLNTYFTVKQPGRRWTDLQEAHELYCAGHMIEAAVAYAECTGKTRLLDVMRRMADHIYRHFVTEGAPGWSGHPEIELALLRLYRCTGEKRYQELALHFLNVRGTSDYFAEESRTRGWTVWGADPRDQEYTQSQSPVRQQEKAVGHAVRAVYLYAGMAEAAAQTGEQELAEACRRLWDNITHCRMYVTGAIGSACAGEAFTKDHDLPNDTAYAETCAAIGLIFFARRMLALRKRGVYADVMERALYNCVLAGMQLDGTRFFYVNPLEVLPGISGEAVTHRHVLPERPKWFACACCPPNVARLLPSIAEYAWSLEEAAPSGGSKGQDARWGTPGVCAEEKRPVLYSHLFLGGRLDLLGVSGGTLTVTTGYPYEGTVEYRFTGAAEVTLAIRIPEWSGTLKLEKNGKPIEAERKDGYAYLEGGFADGDLVRVTFDMSVRRLYADPRVASDTGKVALQRGPLVYCAEGADNEGNVLALFLKRGGEVRVGDYEPETLCGIRRLYAEGVRVRQEDPEALYSYQAPKEEACTVTLVPYYTWGNRGVNEMRVWLPER